MWEYQEFSERTDKYDGGTEYKDVASAIEDPRIRTTIDRAVRALLVRTGQDGWEPIEPIDAYRLWNADRVIHTCKWSMRSTLFGGSHANCRLQEVRLNCRRWKP